MNDPGVFTQPGPRAEIDHQACLQPSFLIPLFSIGLLLEVGVLKDVVDRRPEDLRDLKNHFKGKFYVLNIPNRFFA